MIDLLASCCIVWAHLWIEMSTLVSLWDGCAINELLGFCKSLYIYALTPALPCPACCHARRRRSSSRRRTGVIYIWRCEQKGTAVVMWGVRPSRILMGKKIISSPFSDSRGRLGQGKSKVAGVAPLYLRVVLCLPWPWWCESAICTALVCVGQRRHAGG